MSIKLMSLVWDIESLPATTKLVLLSLCDCANNDGESCFPSIKVIAEKSSISHRQAQRLMHRLIECGAVSVIKNENGGEPGATRHYRINVNKLETGDILTPVTGDIDDEGRVTPVTETGDAHVTLITINHQDEPSDPIGSTSDEKELSITKAAIDAAAALATGWDIQYLENKFLDFCRSDKSRRPRNPDAAFIAWVPKFTKNKPPGEFDGSKSEPRAERTDGGDRLQAYQPFKNKRDDWRKRLSEYRRDGWWQKGWGPEPGQAGCRVPPELLH